MCATSFSCMAASPRHQDFTLCVCVCVGIDGCVAGSKACANRGTLCLGCLCELFQRANRCVCVCVEFVSTLVLLNARR